MSVEAFLAAGFTRQNVLEVILGVATKVMSNYTNHIVHTQYDPFMKGNEWTKLVKSAALTRALGASISFGGLST